MAAGNMEIAEALNNIFGEVGIGKIILGYKSDMDLHFEQLQIFNSNKAKILMILQYANEFEADFYKDKENAKISFGMGGNRLLRQIHYIYRSNCRGNNFIKVKKCNDIPPLILQLLNYFNNLQIDGMDIKNIKKLNAKLIKQVIELKRS